MPRSRRYTSATATVLICCACTATVSYASPANAEQSRSPQSPKPSLRKNAAAWSPTWGLLLGGVAITGLAYVLPCSAYGTSTACIPVAGPFYEAGRRIAAGEYALGIMDPIVIGTWGFLHLAGPTLITVGLIGRQTAHDSAASVVAYPSISATDARLNVIGEW